MTDPLLYFKRFGHAPYFWARQVAHFLGGAVISIIGHVLSLWVPKVWVIPTFLAVLSFIISHKEIKESSHQSFYKTGTDMASWIFGFLLVTWICL